ncbi:hypothetical protein SAMN05444008_11548 [Cnuella takakiae]|uniref:Uncharacterized protein n=1 Tax=Cnuella takakiae TaxID=1302690 RepID=A0A1M5G0N0_9BACT|nr:hypothetical protein [Cnuella takakiae]OLY92282.1 hypothetical protein BUE76_10550 [Cnuella takakiae]SHF97204.1 hypothetical protein SAMN05444008_11548 [Cnuella takakiae]
MEASAHDPNVKEANLNLSQALIHIINANVCYNTWPRAGGKTSGGIGPRILHLSETMPRSQIGLICDTFERIDKSLLPGLKAYWGEELGLLEDIDYVVGKRPPDHWTKPLFVPKDWGRVVAFQTGFIVCQISLAVNGSANGFNLQAVIGDEVKYWDEAKFKSEVKPAIRGGRKHFGHLPEFQSQWFFSDKYPSKGADISWVLKKKADVDWDAVQTVFDLQLYAISLQQQAEACESESTRYRYEKELEEIEALLRELRKDLVYYRDAQPYENQEALGDKFFRDLKRDLSEFEYDVAVKNMDPDKAIVPYYPDFTQEHLYNFPYDVNPNKGLIISLDYQHSITPVVTAQFDQLPGSPWTTLNFVQSLHSIPGDLNRAMEMWCEAFADHQEKLVYYIYDHTAIARSPYGSTYKDMVCAYLAARDWAVVEVFTGDAPDHGVKYEAIRKWLRCQADKAIRMNEARNTFLKKSIEKTDAELVNGKTKKDKRSERSKRIPPEEATHYPDTFDMIVWGALELELVPMYDTGGIDLLAR